MKKGIEILKEVYFCTDKETAKTYNMEYSETIDFMQILIDYDKKEIRIFKKSNWNSDYDSTEIVKF